jgi:uncharacterized C2H2 Zn-finger protein
LIFNSLIKIQVCSENVTLSAILYLKFKDKGSVILRNQVIMKKTKCNNCDFFYNEHDIYLKHCSVHKNDKNAIFKCSYCLSVFKNYKSFRSHFNKFHINDTKPSILSVNSLEDYRCKFETCLFNTNSRQLILEHTRFHIVSAKTEVICPFKNCAKKLPTKNYFNVHVHRDHSSHTNNEKTQTLMNHSSLNILESLENSFEPPNIISQKPILCDSSKFSEISDDNVVHTRRDILTDIFLKLKTEHFVTEEVIQCLVEEFSQVEEDWKITTEVKIEKICQQHNLFSLKDTLLTELTQTEVFPNLSKMKTTHRRGKHYKSLKNYIHPVKIVLGTDDYHHTCFFHYVPVLDTIKNYLNGTNLSDFFQKPRISDKKIMDDIFDGTIYRSNSFFVDGVRKIELILYQDAFELCICIGSAKKKFKLIGVYIAFANLGKFDRFKLENIQLVLLCRNKHLEKFKIADIFRQLILDLKILETEGVDVNGKKYLGSLVGMAGDNLGQHQIGGLTENFSTANYICRYCYTTKENLKNFDYSVKEERTIATHARDLNQLQCLNQDSKTNSYNGVKHDSILNGLKYFHTCQLGLPPCIAHDLFEGVIQFDLILIIHHFAAKKKLSTIF